MATEAISAVRLSSKPQASSEPEGSYGFKHFPTQFLWAAELECHTKNTWKIFIGLHYIDYAKINWKPCTSSDICFLKMVSWRKDSGPGEITRFVYATGLAWQVAGSDDIASMQSVVKEGVM